MDSFIPIDRSEVTKYLQPYTAAILVCGIVSWILGRALYNLFLHPLRSYPGPFLWRISGIPADYHIFRGTVAARTLQTHQKYGPVVRLAPNELSFADGRVWKDVWDHRPEFPKDPHRAQRPPNGIPSILAAEKNAHARYRRLLAHAFSEKGLREQHSRIQQYVDLLIDRLSERAQVQQTTDMVDWYTITVFDVIGDLAWGEAFHGLRDRQVHEWIPAILGNLQYVMQAAIFNRRGLGMFRSLLVSKDVNEKRKKNFSLAAKMVNQRIESGGDSRGDFWDRVLIKSVDDNAAGEGMSREEMLNNASVLILAGAETSATTPSGATYLLLKNPEKMKILTDEIRTTFTSDNEIDVYSVNRLNYMLAVLDETMRLYPPVPDPSARNPPRGGGLVCGKWLPENTVIHANQLALALSEDNFHRPREFIPERWLDDAPPEFANDDRAAVQPFATGVRNCIGRNLAYAEMKLILTQVLFHFDLELDVEHTGDWFDQTSFGVWFKGPLHVKLSAA